MMNDYCFYHSRLETVVDFLRFEGSLKTVSLEKASISLFLQPYETSIAYFALPHLQPPFVEPLPNIVENEWPQGEWA